MATLYVTCGISGSGKSYWAREWVKFHPFTCIVSTDSIRLEMWGDEGNQHRPDLVFDEAFRRARVKLKEGWDVIFDATNVKVRDRKRVLKEIGSVADRTICVVFECDIEKSLENQKNRERKVPRKVLERQFKNFQKPTFEEGWNDIFW